MRRLIAISSLCAVLCSACVGEEADTTVASPPAATPDSRPNILLIIGHVGATCSPTRSLLLTGVDNHRSGLGNMHEFLTEGADGPTWL